MNKLIGKPYYTRSDYGKCNKCKMRSVSYSNFVNEKYCKVCTCITLRKRNQTDCEINSIKELIIFDNVNPSYLFLSKCPVPNCCYLKVYDIFCESHRDYHDEIFERETWKICYYWISECTKHKQIKEYLCKKCLKIYCKSCFIESHLTCNNISLENEIINYKEDVLIKSIYDELNQKYPKDLILEMIGDNMGICSKYILRQLEYFKTTK